MPTETAPSPHSAAPPERERYTRAHIAALKLSGFRNYAVLSLPLDSRSVVLTGPNGAGKTNLLEAVSFLSPGRGMRGVALDEVARRPGDGGWAVAARIVNAFGMVEVGTGIALAASGPDARRSVRVNHAPARSSEALLEHLRVLWLTPAMDGLFVGPASERRRFLDRAVLAIDRKHGTRFNAFEKAMRSRNRLLADPSPDERWLAAIETEMAELGIAISAARREWLTRIAALTAGAERNAPFPSAGITLSGLLEEDLAGRASTEAEDRYRVLLAAERRRDAAAGRTLAGPHLTDLLVRHAPKDVPASICSTGEQKALLIGLVLAQARLTTHLAGETPVILLDEIAAHLDQWRREALFSILADLDCQTFMTGTDPFVFSDIRGSVQSFAVTAGRIEPALAGE